MMKSVAAAMLAMALAACDGVDPYPPLDDPDASIPIRDGAVDDAPVDAGGDGGQEVVGRVCLLTDLRKLNLCANTGAGGLTVTTNGITATTNDNGTFLYTPPAGAANTWIVTGSTIVTSVVPLASTDAVQLPVIGETEYEALLTTNAATVQAGQGSIVVRLVDGATAVANATVIVNQSPSPSLYDGDTPTVWDRDVTGALGIAWLPGNDAGSRTLIITPMNVTPFTRTATVVDQAITFVTIEL